MKIAHIVCRFPPYAGGMGIVAYEQVKSLAENGHQVTVFTLNQKEKLESDNFKIKYIKTLCFGNAGICPSLLWQLRKFDVVQLHYPFYGAQEFVWLAKKFKLLKSSKLIIWYHMDATARNLFRKILQLSSWPIQKHLFKLADKICSASLDYVKNSKIKKIFKKYREKFVEIPFGSNQHPETVSQLQVAELKNKLHIKSEKIILFVGGLDSAHYFKGVPVLIDAIKKIPKLRDKLGVRDPDSRSDIGINNLRIKLVIVGDGNLRGDYERQVAGSNLQNQVVFTGRIKFDELKNYYALCDVTVLPSTTSAEAFGLVLIEAKTYGKPVIGSDLPGVRDVVGQSGLIAKAGDSNDLAEKIKKILTDESLYNNFSRNAIQEVKEKYNWDKHTQKLNDLYQS